MILKGEHLFVTGGAAGIGEAIVLGGVKEGAKVSFVDIDDTKANALVDKLTKAFPVKDSSPITILKAFPVTSNEEPASAVIVPTVEFIESPTTISEVLPSAVIE